MDGSRAHEVLPLTEEQLMLTATGREIHSWGGSGHMGARVQTHILTVA